MKVKEFTHESGFNSVQGKYSIGYNTRGLLMASEDYCEMKREMSYSPLVIHHKEEPQLRVNEFGDLVYPPEKPVPPKPIDTSKWVNMTPKRREKLAQYRRDQAQYEADMEDYLVALDKWHQLPFADEGRDRDEFIMDLINAIRTKPIFMDMTITRWSYHEYLNGTFEYEVPVFQYGKYRVFRNKKMVEKYTRSELPEWAVARHEMEILEVEEGDWVQREIYDPKWRIENQEVLRKWKKQHRKDFIRNQPDSTVQTTLTNNCWNAREVTSSILFTFEGEDTQLARDYLNSLMGYGRPVLNGRYRIPDIYMEGTPQDIEELSRRAKMVRGHSL